MRIARLALAGSLAALVALASPALAKSSERQKADDKSTASEPVCQAYQQAPDGTWAQLPCGQTGGATGSTQQRSTSKNADEETR